MRKIMASLDIGNATIKLVVGEMIKNKLNILATSEVPTTGLSKNKVVSKENMLADLKMCFLDCEAKLGFKIHKCLVTVPANNCEFAIGEGAVNVLSEDKVITGKDIVNVLHKSIEGIVQSNMELVTIIPTVFRLDNNVTSKDPKNMISNKLGVKAVIVMVYKKDIYDILDCLKELNIDVLDIAFDSLGDYYANQYQENAKEVGAIINIGASKTTISIFNKGILTNTQIIDIGSNNIDNDIAFIYKIKKKDALYLKEKFALASSRLASANEVMKVNNRNNEIETINQIEISEIVASRLEEILNIAKKQINILTKKEISYIICTGGTTEMRDFKITLENIFGKKARVGKILELGVRNNKFSSAVGLIKWYNYNQILKSRDYSILSIHEQEEFSGILDFDKITDNSVIGKVFGYFFDN